MYLAMSGDITIGPSMSSPPPLQQALEKIKARDWPQAEALIRQALASTPNHPKALWMLGDCLNEQGRFTEAADAYRAVAKLDPKLPVHNNLGYALLSVGDIPGAIAAWTIAAQRDPNNPVIACNLGGAHQSAGAYNDAITWLRRALAIDPNDVQSLVNLAASLQALYQF